MADESLDQTPVVMTSAALGGHGSDNRGLEAGSIPGMAMAASGACSASGGRALPDEALQDIAAAMIKVDERRRVGARATARPVHARSTQPPLASALRSA